MTRQGATVEAGGVRFCVWAPRSERVSVRIEGRPRAEMRAIGEALFEAFVEGARAGDRYKLEMNGHDPMPDPATRFQPEGVHGPSEVIDPSRFPFRASWKGRARSELVIYELHAGTFTPEGNWAAARTRLDHLAALGVTAIELMPLADFPGRWGWGYDGAALFAPCRAYGRPEELAAFIDAAHAHGIAVILDVVFNHFGPDGSYACAFSPDLLNDRHHTPWGSAVNLDGPRSMIARRFFIECARSWLEDYRFDGLRLDAVFALIDEGPVHFLSELSAEVEKFPGPRRFLIAEDSRNERRVISPRSAGGHGLDAVWSDDFHHQMRRIVAKDREGYFRDFEDRTEDLARCIDQGWLFTGEHSPHHGHPRGTPTAGLSRDRFVFFVQNHDQIGNRPLGDRLNATVAPEVVRAAASLLFFLPEIPLLFMGEEWAASTPFQFFSDHGEPLGSQVSAGRKKELGGWFSGFGGEVPDPQDPKTFERSKLRWEELESPEHKKMLALYRDLIAHRKELGGELRVRAPSKGTILLERGSEILIVALEVPAVVELPDGASLVWTSEEARYALDPVVPVVEGGRVVFTRAAAARFVR
jgi:maltooligosyltrehalose trehalohydrolase